MTAARRRFTLAEETREQSADGAAAEGGLLRQRSVSRQDLGLGDFVTGQRLPVRGQVQRLSIREEARELVLIHARPGAHVARVDMHESARTVIPHAAILEAHGGSTQACRVHVRQADIHRPAEHVLAVLGNAAGAAPQHAVRFRRAIGRNDIHRFTRADFAIKLPKNVEEARVHLDGLVRAPIAQQPVQLRQSLLVITSVAPKGNGQAFAGMSVEYCEAAGIAVGDGVLRAFRSTEKCQRRPRLQLPSFFRLFGVW